MLKFGTALASAFFLFLAFNSHTPGAIGFSILMTVVCGTIAIFSFAAARIDTRSQNQVYVPSPEEAALLRERAQRQREQFAQKRRGVPPPVRPELRDEPPGDGG